MDEKFLKLTNLAYRIADFFPESDPLKNKAKEKILHVMDNATILLGTDGWESLQKERIKNQLTQDITLLLQYFSLAKSQGYLNATNFLILVKEYEHIKKELVLPIELNITIPSLPRKTINEVSLNQRQKKILHYLHANKKAQVMDLEKVLQGVTKRTIRRDLEDLLKKNKICREGSFNQIFYKLVEN